MGREGTKVSAYLGLTGTPGRLPACKDPKPRQAAGAQDPYLDHEIDEIHSPSSSYQ